MGDEQVARWSHERSRSVAPLRARRAPHRLLLALRHADRKDSPGTRALIRAHPACRADRRPSGPRCLHHPARDAVGVDGAAVQVAESHPDGAR